MTIVLTGGGSGGHIIPALAIASELKKLQPTVRVIFIGQTGDGLLDVPRQHPAVDEVYSVQAGKFRRYHGAGWRQVFDIGTQAKNLRDALKVLVGIWQSYWLIRHLRPDIIFTKGGYVSVPVALGGALNGVPYITHDSDSTPSLASRIIARWASLHTVALPKQDYPYPQDKTITVGVPVSSSYRPVDKKLQQQYREEVGLSDYAQVLLVTGGGNGAGYLNQLLVTIAPELLRRFPELAIAHMSGRMHETDLTKQYDTVLDSNNRQRVLVRGFVTDLYRYSGAADLIVARGGASALAEFSLQGKACIVIPAKQLIWQTRHAQALAKHAAIAYLDESTAEKPGVFLTMVADILSDQKRRTALAEHLSTLGHPDAAKLLAMVLLEQTHNLNAQTAGMSTKNK